MKISELKTNKTEYGYWAVQCPVCGEWKPHASIKAHISGKHDAKHRAYYLIIGRYWVQFPDRQQNK